MLNILTVDVEDYFHPTEIQNTIRITEWDRLPSRVELATRKVLDLLRRYETQATFFVLGWVADRHPRLIYDIHRAGHEIGCHSYEHRLVYDLTPSQFREDTERAVLAIRKACGVTPRLYRAPSYSITDRSMWALEILAGLGFTHDSSIYPISHDRYGVPGFSRHVSPVRTRKGSILEVPAATVKLSGARVAPVGGGGYLRLLPYRYTAAGIRRMNNSEGLPACMYFHPWELDPDQPRLASGAIARLRTYSGLRGMESKLLRLLSDFQFTTLTAVYPPLQVTNVPQEAVTA